MMIRSHKYIAATLCLLLAVGITLGGSGTILCIGECGQSRLETVILAQCSETGHGDSRATIDHTTAEHFHCGDCADVDVDSYQWLRRSRFVSGVHSAVQATAQAAGTIGSVANTPANYRCTAKRPPASSTHATAIKSITVLQC